MGYQSLKFREMGYQEEGNSGLWDTNLKIQEGYGIYGENVLGYGIFFNTTREMREPLRHPPH